MKEEELVDPRKGREVREQWHFLRFLLVAAALHEDKCAHCEEILDDGWELLVVVLHGKEQAAPVAMRLTIT